jgi:hypothetical protein
MLHFKFYNSSLPSINGYLTTTVTKYIESYFIQFLFSKKYLNNSLFISFLYIITHAFLNM